MRQDPEVILVGEIRDAETVATVFQAALTGHLVFSTLHAGSAAGALSRLIVTDSIPVRRKSENIVVLSIAELLGKAIKNIHEETSVTSLFV